MTNILKVSIPLNPAALSNTQSLKEAVANLIMENQDEFHPYLERLISQEDARTTIVDDSLNIEIEDIDANTSGGIAHGRFESDYYAGCKDVDGMNDHEITLEFEIDNNSMEFEIELPPPWIIEE